MASSTAPTVPTDFLVNVLRYNLASLSSIFSIFAPFKSAICSKSELLQLRGSTYNSLKERVVLESNNDANCWSANVELFGNRFIV